MPKQTVAVIGGGVTGLIAGRALARSGLHPVVFESSERLGGQVRTVRVGGHAIDVGAESLHRMGATIPGLDDDPDLTAGLCTARDSHTWVYAAGRLRRLPAGVGPGGPTKLLPVLGARTLSPCGVLRAAMEPLVRRGPLDGDVSVGDLIGHRFGHEVVERLVDPLLGSLHGGDVHRISVGAALPELAATAARHRSLLLARRPGRRSRGPVPESVSFPKGLGELVDRLAADSRLDIRTGHSVRSVHPVGPRHRLDIDRDDTGGDDRDFADRDFDAVVLAVGPRAAARILARTSAAAATELGGVRAASVSTVIAAFPRTAGVAALPGTGLLVSSREPYLLKAATFLSAKWAHLDDGPDVYVRLSAGRITGPQIGDLDDTELTGRLLADLTAITGFDAVPTAVHVQRWPHTSTQLESGHGDRIDLAEQHLSEHPGLVLAGAGHRGIGLTSCIRSGLAAAGRVTAHLDSGAASAHRYLDDEPGVSECP